MSELAEIYMVWTFSHHLVMLSGVRVLVVGYKLKHWVMLTRSPRADVF